MYTGYIGQEGLNLCRISDRKGLVYTGYRTVRVECILDIGQERWVHTGYIGQEGLSVNWISDRKS